MNAQQIMKPQGKVVKFKPAILVLGDHQAMPSPNPLAILKPFN